MSPGGVGDKGDAGSGGAGEIALSWGRGHLWGPQEDKQGPYWGTGLCLAPGCKQQLAGQALIKQGT